MNFLEAVHGMLSVDLGLIVYKTISPIAFQLQSVMTSPFGNTRVTHCVERWPLLSQSVMTTVRQGAGDAADLRVGNSRC
jgi:hypothetical protein